MGQCNCVDDKCREAEQERLRAAMTINADGNSGGGSDTFLVVLVILLIFLILGGGYYLHYQQQLQEERLQGYYSQLVEDGKPEVISGIQLQSTGGNASGSLD